MEKVAIWDQTAIGKMTDITQLSTVILIEMITLISLNKNIKIYLEVLLDKLKRKILNTIQLVLPQEDQRLWMIIFFKQDKKSKTLLKMSTLTMDRKKNPMEATTTDYEQLRKIPLFLKFMRDFNLNTKLIKI